MSFADKTLKQFTKELASSAAVPGGGGASALLGAVGIALGNMVAALTIGKKKYADVSEEMERLSARAEELGERFLSFIDADAEAFAPLAKAYGIPKDDPAREEIMENALKDACAVPMDIMRTCGEALTVTEVFAQKGSQLAISDAGCAAAACLSALRAAYLNVLINTRAMKDTAYAQNVEKEADELLARYAPFAERIYEQVTERIRK